MPLTAPVALQPTNHHWSGDPRGSPQIPPNASCCTRFAYGHWGSIGSQACYRGAGKPRATAIRFTCLHELGLPSVCFLLREFRQLPLNIRPGLQSINDAGDGAAYPLLIGPYLLGAIPVPEGECVVLDSLEVDSNTQRRAELVVP